MKKSQYDVLIIGGSHAGLSAAMAIGRLRRSALIVDSGEPRNAVSLHANNIAGLDGQGPDHLRAQAREDLRKYETIHYEKGSILQVNKAGSLFEAQLATGKAVVVRKVILAYGVKDNLPNIENIKQLWGKFVFHCPYCHGFEVSDQTIGLLANGPFAEHMLPMLKNLSANIILFAQGALQLTEDFKAKISKSNIKVIESPLKSLNINEQKLKSALTVDGTEVEIDALFVSPLLPFTLKSSLAEELGCEKTDMGIIKVGEMGGTNIRGVFAAGDIMTMRHSVVAALASGQLAGSGAVYELSVEDFT